MRPNKPYIPPTRKVDKELARAMYDNGKGMKQADIARHFGVTHQCIQYHLSDDVKRRVIATNRKITVERLKNDEEFRARVAETRYNYFKKRYAEDAEFRAKVLARNAARAKRRKAAKRAGG